MSLHQLADQHPWQPGAWVSDTEYYPSDPLAAVSLTVVTDHSELVSLEREAVNLTTRLLSEQLVAFERQWNFYRCRSESPTTGVKDAGSTALWRFFAERTLVMKARHDARRKLGR